MGASKTLANLEDLVRNLTFEESGDVGLFKTTARLDDLIQIAHRELYLLVATTAPEFLLSVTGDQTVTSSGWDFSATGVLSIERVENKDSTANYIPVAKCGLREVGIRDGPSAVSLDIDQPFYYHIVGEKLYTVPTMTTSVTLRMFYVATPTDITDSGTPVAPFGGKLAMFHDLVAIRAADIAMTKDNQQSRLHYLYLEKRKDMLDYCKRGLSRGYGRKVLAVQEDY